MRITFLVYNLDGMGGTSRSAITQAGALAGSSTGEHEVTILSVTRSASAPHHHVPPSVRVDYLVDLVGPSAPRLDRGDALTSEEATRLAGLQSRYVPRRWDRHFTRLVDLALEQTLPLVDADVVVTTTPELLTVAAQLLPPGPALVHQEHRSTAQRGADLEPLLVFAPRADVVVTLTERNASWLSQQLGAQRPRILAMPNPLPHGFAPRSRLDQPLIVAAGRLAPEKQYPQLIQAFALLAEDLPDWRLRIYGAGPRRRQLLSLVRQFGLYDRVELPGSTDNMAAEWAKASISALTSRSEGFPLVLQEAMAAGVPVVSYDCPTGPRAIIEHEVDGLLVEPDSVSALAQALRRVASDVELRHRLGAGALASSRQYDAAVIAGRWESVFAEAVTLRRERSRAVPPEELPDPDRSPVGAAPQLTPEEARSSALAWAARAAESSSSRWFVIPPHRDEPATVVVPAERRVPFLEALGAPGAPSYLSLLEPGLHGWDERRGTVPGLALELQRAACPAVVLAPWPTDEGGPTHLGTGCSVVVEFWQRDDSGALLAPGTNRYGRVVTSGTTLAPTEVHGLPVPTVHEMTLPVVDECAFPVDVVYTWVDGSDPAWNDAREARSATHEGAAVSRESSGAARFVSRDELRYSMRSLHLYAPWVRTIHLVTAGQVPPWLDTDHPRINLVDHRDVLPADALPTFNSHAIETRLHHVPDLSEHFVYINDDVLLGRPLRPEQFFTPGGASSVFLADHVVGLPGQQKQPYLRAAATNRQLLQDAFGVYTTHTMAHTPHPHRRSVLAEIEGRFPEAIAATTRSPFRADSDVSLLSSLAQHYGLLTGTAVEATCAQTYVNLGGSDLARILATLGARDRDFICFADHHDHALPEADIATLLRGFFMRYFPLAAPWERADGAPAD